jgi:hypothetical protein
VLTCRSGTRRRAAHLRRQVTPRRGAGWQVGRPRDRRAGRHAQLGGAGAGGHPGQRAAGQLRRQRALARVPGRRGALPAARRPLHPGRVHVLPAAGHREQAVGGCEGARRWLRVRRWVRAKVENPPEHLAGTARRRSLRPCGLPVLHAAGGERRGPRLAQLRDRVGSGVRGCLHHQASDPPPSPSSAGGICPSPRL